MSMEYTKLRFRTMRQKLQGNEAGRPKHFPITCLLSKDTWLYIFFYSGRLLFALVGCRTNKEECELPLIIEIRPKYKSTSANPSRMPLALDLSITQCWPTRPTRPYGSPEVPGREYIWKFDNWIKHVRVFDGGLPSKFTAVRRRQYESPKAKWW